jgi:Tol biopolymer transport system component/DNA-binding winged helix-turn-helix (wHTH) protein
MLNRHENLLVQHADLLRVGDCLVDIPRREVRSAHGAQRITLKSLQVLLVLVRHASRVVGREALIEWVWPDTLPTDDVLTQAIAQLRKALGDDRESPRYVETIAKGGYRLLAPVEWVDADGRAIAVEPAVPAMAAVPSPAAVAAPVAVAVPESTAQPAAVHPAIDADAGVAALPEIGSPAARARWPLAAAAAGALVLIAGVGLWPARQQASRPGTVPPVVAAATDATLPEVERITSMPGTEDLPALSPDGSQVVYSVAAQDGDHAELRVQTLAPVTGRPLVSGAPAGVVDTLPAWSPDGRQVAFVRKGPGADACSIQLVPATGGASRAIAACDGWNAGVGWSPDGRRLVSTRRGALQLIDLTSGEQSALAYGKRPEDVDSLPVFSPDGQWIAFKRNISAADIWRVRASGGAPQQVTRLRTNLYGLAWGPGGRSLVFGRYQDGRMALVQADAATGAVRIIGPEGSAFPSVAAEAPIAAFTISAARSKIFSVALPPAGAAAAGPLVPEFESAGDELLATISPDGQQVAFYSDRSGTTALWIGSLGRPDSLRRVPGLVPVPRYGPAWSPDGRSLLLVGRPVEAAGAAQPAQPAAVYEVAVGSDSVRRLPATTGEAIYATYGPDHRLLLIDDQGGGRLELSLYDRARQPWSRLASIRDVSYVLPDPRRHRILFTRPAQRGLWAADEGLRDVASIDEGLTPDGARRILVDDHGVQVVGTSSSCGMLLHGLSPGTSRNAVCLQRKPAMITGLGRDPVHGRLYISIQQEDRSDIAWMRLPAETVRR